MQHIDTALTDEQCDRLVALTMDKLAQKHSTPNGAMHAVDLNPSVTEHHALRRSIVRAAYELGKLAGVIPPNVVLSRALTALGEVQDATEWAEKGIIEWRSEALRFKGLHHDCATQLRVALRERDEALRVRSNTGLGITGGG